MSNLIKALQIFLKYGDEEWPTNCSHDEFAVMIDPAIVSDEDIVLLDDLGFFPEDGEDWFVSYKYGSC